MRGLYCHHSLSQRQDMSPVGDLEKPESLPVPNGIQDDLDLWHTRKGNANSSKCKPLNPKTHPGTSAYSVAPTGSEGRRNSTGRSCRAFRKLRAPWKGIQSICRGSSTGFEVFRLESQGAVDR